MAGPDANRIAKRFADTRAALDMSPEDMAETLSCTVADIERWEQGDAHPSVSALSFLHSRFGVNPDWLLYGRGPAPRFG